MNAEKNPVYISSLIVKFQNKVNFPLDLLLDVSFILKIKEVSRQAQ